MPDVIVSVLWLSVESEVWKLIVPCESEVGHNAGEALYSAANLSRSKLFFYINTSFTFSHGTKRATCNWCLNPSKHKERERACVCVQVSLTPAISSTECACVLCMAHCHLRVSVHHIRLTECQKPKMLLENDMQIAAWRLSSMAGFHSLSHSRKILD
jgi:hypothetical protein